MKLKDKAREYYGALLPLERPTTMIEMRNWFRRVFGRKLTMSVGKRELELCIRNPGEPLGEFAQRLKVIANNIFPASSLNTGEKLYHRNLFLVNQFVEGPEGRLANVLRARELYSLNECLETAEQCEEIVSRMIPETRYDARMSVIRRIEADNGGTMSSVQDPPLHTLNREQTPYSTECFQQEASPPPRRYNGRNNQIRQGRRETRVRCTENHRYQEEDQKRAPQGNNRRRERNSHPARGPIEGNSDATSNVSFLQKYAYMRN